MAEAKCPSPITDNIMEWTAPSYTSKHPLLFIFIRDVVFYMIIRTLLNMVSDVTVHTKPF